MDRVVEVDPDRAELRPDPSKVQREKSEGSTNTDLERKQ